MKPVIKYQGGKTRELPLIDKYKPAAFSRIVEPFCGGAAVSFYYGIDCLLNDINPMLINLYKVIQSENYSHVQNRINQLKTFDHDALEPVYYAARMLLTIQSITVI